jgi:hypothetical protein
VLFRTGSVMVLVGAVISLCRIPLSMSNSPGAPSLVAALSSVGLVWPLLGECLIVIASVRALAARVRQPLRRETIVDRIAIERRAGVALVAVGGALLLALAMLDFFCTTYAVLHITGPRGVATVAAPVIPQSGFGSALFLSWIVCLGVGAAMLIASEVELRRRA